MLTFLATLLPLALVPAPFPQQPAPQQPAPQQSEAARFPDFPEQDALRYDLDLRVDPANRLLQGRVRYAIRAEEPLTRLRFHARHSDSYRVEFRQGDRTLPAQWHEDTVTVSLPKPVAKGATIELEALLDGTPVDGFYFKNNRYGEPLAFTDHYSIRARGWLPCEDHPADRALWRTRLTYPEGKEVVVYGTEVEAAANPTRPPAGFVSASFASDAAIPPYMYALVVGPFTRVPEAGDARLTPHLVYTRDVARARRVLVHHGRWIAAMESAFGPYPYAKYTTVQCPTRWGGFEAPGNVQLSEGLFDRDGVGTLAHELVHMWFGDGVGYARWREVWLSEGFASYFGPWLHAQAGGPTLPASMAAMRDRWRKSFEGRIKTIRDDRFPHPDQALNSNTYPKGAWVLHMLRGELGDQLFFKALQTYYRRCSGRSVVTKDFVDTVEQVAGQDLDWFFDQWLDRVDCPHLAVRSEPGKLLVEQVQKGAPYRFWLRLGYRVAGEDLSKRVRVTAKVTTIPLPGPVTGLRIDPRVELLFRDKSR